MKKCLTLFWVLLWIGRPLMSEETEALLPPIFQSIVVYQQPPTTLPEGEGIHCLGFFSAKINQKLQLSLQAFLSKPITTENLLAIKREILHFFAAQSQELVAVEIPEQKVEQGRVCFRVLESKVAKVSYIGRKWMPLWQYTNHLDLKIGDTIHKEALLNQAAWLNFNPFRQVDIVFSPGEEEGTTEVEFLIQDRFPLGFSVGIENTGSNLTGRNRILSTLRWGNAFGLGDLLTYQWSSSDHIHKFYSHFGSYQMYLPWKHLVEIYGAYAAINPKDLSFRGEGKNIQASFRYIWPFSPLYKSFKQQLCLGIDYKAMNTDLFFTAQNQREPAYTKVADLTQALLAYEWQGNLGAHTLFSKLEIIGSPYAFLPKQNDSAYHRIRSQATPIYGYTKLQIDYLYFTPYWIQFFLGFKGQLATHTLLPSETLGLGGARTVRGFSERVYIADEGILANLESRALFPRLGKSLLSFLLFTDLGWGYNYHSTSFVLSDSKQILKSPTSALLWSAGAGLRWEIAPYLQARADYGFALYSSKEIPKKRGKLHFSVVSSW